MDTQHIIDLPYGEPLRLSEIHDVVPGEVSRTPLVMTDAGRIMYIAFDAGTEWPTHPAPGHALVRVIDGEIDFTLGGNVHHMDVGDAIVLSPPSPHSVRATTASKIMVIALTAKDAGAGEHLINVAYDTVFDIRKVLEVPAGAINRAPLAMTDEARIVYMALDASAERPTHPAPGHALVQILSGRVEFTYKGAGYELSEGGAIVMEPGAMHAVKALAPSTMMVTAFTNA